MKAAARACVPPQELPSSHRALNVFDGQLLGARYAFRDQEMLESLQAMAEQRLRRVVHSTPYSVRVRQALMSQAWPERIDMEGVAAHLGLSVRSLRRLAEEGKTYSAIFNEALAIVAKQLLRNDRLTVEAITRMMGFSAKSTFYRSFRRWTGMTPAAYRRDELRRRLRHELGGAGAQ